MRFSHYIAGAALAASIALTGCAGNGSPTSSAGSQTVIPMGHRAAGAHFILAKGVKLVKDRCPASKFAFCVTISPENTGPYWAWCGNASCSGSQYNMTASSTISMTRSGKNMDRQLPSYFSPSPGNPTSVYITEHKTFTPGLNPKFTQSSEACYTAYPSSCFHVTVGLIPGS